MNPVTPEGETLLASETIEGRRIEALVSNRTPHPEWDAWLESTELGHFQQSSAWAAVKGEEGWETCRVVFRENSRICAGFQVLVRRTRFGKVAYLSKGPVITEVEKQGRLGTFVTGQLIAMAQQHRWLALIAQAPDFGHPIEEHLSQGGFSPLGLSSIISATHCVEVDRPGVDWRKGMRKTTQSQVRMAVRRGVTIRVGGEEDLPVFFDLMLKTCERQGTSPNPSRIESLHSLWKHFSAMDRIRVTLGEHEGKVLAAALCLRFGKRVTLWKKGWNSQGYNLHPNDLVFYESIEWTQSIGCQWMDFVGMDPEIARSNIANKPLTPEQSASRYVFLMRFGGVSQLLPPAQIYFRNPILRFLYPKITPLLLWWERKKRERKERSRKAPPSTAPQSDSPGGERV